MDFRSKSKKIHIHLYVIATKYSRINALVEYNINYIPKSSKIIFDNIFLVLSGNLKVGMLMLCYFFLSNYTQSSFIRNIHYNICMMFS